MSNKFKNRLFLQLAEADTKKEIKEIAVETAEKEDV